MPTIKIRAYVESVLFERQNVQIQVWDNKLMAYRRISEGKEVVTLRVSLGESVPYSLDEGKTWTQLKLSGHLEITSHEEDFKTFKSGDKFFIDFDADDPSLEQHLEVSRIDRERIDRENAARPQRAKFNNE